MSEERLKEIKDSIDLQLGFARAIQLGTNTINILDEELELYNEVIRLKEELSKCTRKHWQSKCAEHCINEKILQSRIEKAINKVQYIIDIGFDYDGYNDVDNLKILIDELVDLARQTKNVLNGRSDE